MTPEMKTIIIPNYCPLYAMQECFGPLVAPIGPTPASVAVIGKLLLQTGHEEPEIYEVVPGTTYEPVRLTLGNYNLPYEDIAGVVIPAVNVEPPKVEVEVVEPPKVEVPEIPAAVVEEDPIVEPAAPEVTAKDAVAEEVDEMAKLEAEILAEAELKAATEDTSKDNRSAQNGNRSNRK